MDRRRLYAIVRVARRNDRLSRAYDLTMLFFIIVSLVPLLTHKDSVALKVMDAVACSVFILDYALRWITADFRSSETGIKAFVKYPFSFMAIVDLLSILPSLYLIAPAFKVLRVSRIFRILRIFKFIRYYTPLKVMGTVIRKESRTLGTVLLFAVMYILVCAMVMFNIESGPFFETFFDAVYWSCCTLTTVGYGDIYPVSDIGRAFSMLSSLVGIALVALPSGVITSSYLEEIRKMKEEE